MKTAKKQNLKQAATLKDDVQRWAAEIGVQPNRVQIQHMTKKWASCSTNGRICLSNALLREGHDFREVVIVHELLHLRVPNHGKLFKSLMKAYLPHWEKTINGRVSRMCGYQDFPGRHPGRQGRILGNSN